MWIKKVSKYQLFKHRDVKALQFCLKFTVGVFTKNWELITLKEALSE